MANRRGFTLVEMAVVVVLAGLVAGIALKISSKSGTAECYATTKTQLSAVKEAVERFALKNDRFPMPARRNVGVESPGYGREVLPANIGDLDSVTNTDGTVAVFGALPFQALGIPVENAADCWGNKFTYVVTKDLTDKTKFNNSTDGAMDINTTAGAATPFLAGAGFAIISHGDDQLGAVKNNYDIGGATNDRASRKWCAPNSGVIPPVTAKTANCAANSRILIDAPHNSGKDAAANYFDDLVVYKGKPWRASGGNVYCWGSALLEAVPYTPKPVALGGGKAFIELAGTTMGGCGIADDSKAYCWGANGEGEQGDGAAGAATTAPNLAVKLPAGETAIHLARSGLGSFMSTCALTKSGKVYCWGSNRWTNTEYGFLGNGSVVQWTAIPVLVTIPVGVSITQLTSVLAGYCALGNNGKAYCWGDGDAGLMGNGFFTDQKTPVAVSMPGGVSITSLDDGKVMQPGAQPNRSII